jgi:hypothetical protein
VHVACAQIKEAIEHLDTVEKKVKCTYFKYAYLFDREVYNTAVLKLLHCGQMYTAMSTEQPCDCITVNCGVYYNAAYSAVIEKPNYCCDKLVCAALTYSSTHVLTYMLWSCTAGAGCARLEDEER